ncbi:MAG: efflux RND transporter periplasmic adaptor subunit [Myxococcales bacterium]|nr:efflux RND transporter periplasmic adaptor subunit [Myxococcales bacterium]
MSERPAEHRLDFDLPAATAVPKKRLAKVTVAVALVLAAAFAVGYFERRRSAATLAKATEASQHAVLRVEVVTPKVLASDRALQLPGSVQPLQATQIFARASGYVRKWKADIGDKVKEGQVLAEIETPELDQELAQARAQLMQTQASEAQAKANRDLALANLGRARRLAPSGVVSKAELDQAEAQASVGEANIKVAAANVGAAQANIRRLMQLKAFASVTAPFAGTITQRTVEVGTLVSAANGQPLFRIAAMDPARIFVQIPQDVAPGVRPGVAAAVSVREYPGRKFQGVVTRASGELDPSTRTMTTEIRVPNQDGALMAGMYAEVSLSLPLAHHVLEVPATALLSDARGQHVALVENGKLHLQPVVVERDNGATIDVSSGLTGNESVARIGSAAFVEGMQVEVRPSAKASP